MNRDIIDIQDFTVLVEEATSDVETQDTCYFDEPVIAVAFYGSGNVNLNVQFEESVIQHQYTSGLALSFYADNKVAFEHIVTPTTPLKCLVIATKASKLRELPNQEMALFKAFTSSLVNPTESYVEGPSFFMSPEMQSIMSQLFDNKFKGAAKMMFFKSQVTSLLAHFFGQLSIQIPTDLKEHQKLLLAQDILNNRIDNPPSLNDLAREIGLNTTKLKKNFKEAFGVPVFKYLQNKRLDRAHHLIQEEQTPVQEAAWQVGYDSLSSFSNAFAKKFGYRPSELR